MKSLILLLCFSLCLAACASGGASEEGRRLIAAGRYEEALAHYQAALREEPQRAELRLAVATTRERVITQWLDQAAAARASGQPAEAAALVARAQALDPASEHVRRFSEAERLAQQRALWLAEAETAWARGDGARAQSRLRAILAYAPEDTAALALRAQIEAAQDAAEATEAHAAEQLTTALAKPVSIEFKDASLKQIFEVLARTSGINFVFDKDVRAEQKTTIYLRRATVKEILAAVLAAQQLEQRRLDDGTILVYPNTPAKARDHQALTIKTFHLSHGEARAAAATLRTILKARDIVADDRQNLLVMRDTPAAIRLAERLLAMQDQPEPEVMLEVEILEVKRSHLLDLGIRWPDLLTLTPLAAATGSALTLADIKNATSRTLGATIAPLSIAAGQGDTDVNLLANPRIRTHNRETAKILIGDRVPNITTTATATGFVAESVQYVDVGLKLEVQPTIYLGNEVMIRINLEVSNIVDQIKTKTGTLAYQIGTRNATTVLRLRDGENQVLAGLISDADRSSVSKVPGLGELPVLGRLFSGRTSDGQKTELVLSLTPRLVRPVTRAALAHDEFPAGPEAAVRAPPSPDLATFTEAVPPATDERTTQK